MAKNSPVSLSAALEASSARHHNRRSSNNSVSSGFSSFTKQSAAPSKGSSNGSYENLLEQDISGNRLRDKQAKRRSHPITLVELMAKLKQPHNNVKSKRSKRRSCLRSRHSNRLPDHNKMEGVRFATNAHSGKVWCTVMSVLDKTPVTRRGLLWFSSEDCNGFLQTALAQATQLAETETNYVASLELVFASLRGVKHKRRRSSASVNMAALAESSGESLGDEDVLLEEEMALHEQLDEQMQQHWVADGRGLELHLTPKLREFALQHRQSLLEAQDLLRQHNIGVAKSKKATHYLKKESLKFTAASQRMAQQLARFDRQCVKQLFREEVAAAIELRHFRSSSQRTIGSTISAHTAMSGHTLGSSGNTVVSVNTALSSSSSKKDFDKRSSRRRDKKDRNRSVSPRKQRSPSMSQSLSPKRNKPRGTVSASLTPHRPSRRQLFQEQQREQEQKQHHNSGAKKDKESSFRKKKKEPSAQSRDDHRDHESLSTQLPPLLSV